MTSYERVRYYPEPPSWRTVSEAGEPVFLAPPSLRSAWRHVLSAAVSDPLTVIETRRAGGDLKSALRFLLWRDSARCYGVRSLVATDEVTAVFGRHLAAPYDRLVGPRPSCTGVVIAKNEESRLASALHSLAPLVDELVVVDDESSDATAQVSEEMGARVIRRRLGADFAAQRNAGLGEVRTDWVVHLDADELLEPGLVPLLGHVLRVGEVDAVFVPILNLIEERGEKPVHWPDVQPRIFRSYLRYRGALHERIQGWRRPLFTPLSGPYIVHRKSLIRQHRATLLYNELDPSPYSVDEISAVKEELAKLQTRAEEESSKG